MSLSKSEVREKIFGAADRKEKIEVEGLGTILMEPLKVKDLQKIKGVEGNDGAKQYEVIVSILEKKIYHKESRERIIEDREAGQLLELPAVSPMIQDIVEGMNTVNESINMSISADKEAALDDDKAKEEAKN